MINWFKWLLEDPVICTVVFYLFPEPSGCCRKKCPVALHGKGGKIAIGYILEDELATGSVSYRIALWDCLGKEFRPSFLRNLVTANKRGDDVSKTVP